MISAEKMQTPQLNFLLGALPAANLAPLEANLELVQLRLGDMLYEPNTQLQHAYFPTSAIVSLHYVTTSGASVEISGVGNEGMVGISLFMGGNTTPSSAMVHTSGYAYRLERTLLNTEFANNIALQKMLLRYTQALITQVSQTAACNRHHSVEQQLSRWLLLTLDRITSGEFVLTQELVANMLGVRRESVTAAAASLQGNGCISYRRGHISVLNRKSLEGYACECYAVVRKEMQRLLGAAQT
ncbi:Crp/Fnr family transcriptional regulator [Cellvibrio sp. QJXJ]|uniref:Crp/Fnr family transcriptional regulator n=1 Tax=Cellvibrio sp. QJXJ TaxID=2964606 RepID=UPI0021C45AB0|nr:Crp/Fnr family transcriptional regulator [Cellvibrio sp. QJXJ]UUA74688.1 Crp/Fnr family transcriptional regulator [Cellvibrio sp. QJXJ]